MRLFALWFALVVMVGCSGNLDSLSQKANGGSEIPKRQVTFPELVPTDLGPHGIPLMMDLPEDVTYKSPSGALEITGGADLQIFIRGGHLDLAELKKKETSPSATYPYLATEIDQPDRLVVLQEHGESSYVIFCNLEVAGTQYSVDNRKATWLPTSKQQLAWVLKSIDSIRPAENKKDATTTESD